MSNQDKPEPISFFNIRSGETHYVENEPAVAAYINSSDLGANASRSQDFGWRLSPKWVKLVAEFKQDPVKMQLLTAKLGADQSPSVVQIVYHIYSEQLRQFKQEAEQNLAPFAEDYEKAVKEAQKAEKAQKAESKPKTNKEDSASKAK